MVGLKTGLNPMVESQKGYDRIEALLRGLSPGLDEMFDLMCDLDRYSDRTVHIFNA